MSRAPLPIYACLLALCTVVHCQATHGGVQTSHPPSPPSKLYESFIEHFPGGVTAFNEIMRERADWNPLQIFEFQNYPDYNPQWSKKWTRFEALGPVIPCPKAIFSSFAEGDDEKRICGFVEGSDCTIISIGSHDQWGFEEAMIAKHPHCRIHTFDCYIPSTVPAAIKSQVTFYPVCLGLKDYTLPSGQEFISWPTLVKKIGLTHPPTALKMDIEGFEWTTIPAIIKSNVLVPDSFSFEMHYITPVEVLPWVNRQRTDPEIGLFGELLLSFGYVLVDRHDNWQCPECTELVIAKLLHPTRFHHGLHSAFHTVDAAGAGAEAAVPLTALGLPAYPTQP